MLGWLQEMHKVTLQGKYVLQVDEMVNIAAPARDRCVSFSAHHVLPAGSHQQTCAERERVQGNGLFDAT